MNLKEVLDEISNYSDECIPPRAKFKSPNDSSNTQHHSASMHED